MAQTSGNWLNTANAQNICSFRLSVRNVRSVCSKSLFVSGYDAAQYITKNIISYLISSQLDQVCDMNSEAFRRITPIENLHSLPIQFFDTSAPIGCKSQLLLEGKLHPFHIGCKSQLLLEGKLHPFHLSAVLPLTLEKISAQFAIENEILNPTASRFLKICNTSASFEKIGPKYGNQIVTTHTRQEVQDDENQNKPRKRLSPPFL